MRTGIPSFKNYNGYSHSQAEDALRVVAQWISGNRNIKVNYHDGKRVDADIFKGEINIPRLSCASGIDYELMMLLRSRTYHEAGHIRKTRLDRKEYPGGALHLIWNSLEDIRMEAELSKEDIGCWKAFTWAQDFHNKKIAKKKNEGTLDAPLWEAMVSMMVIVSGHIPAWSVSPKAQAYIDESYSDFSKVHKCRTAKDCLKIAKVIYAKLKNVNEQWKKENPQMEIPIPIPEKKPRKESKEKESEEQDGAGIGKDFDDYENEEPETEPYTPEDNPGEDPDEEPEEDSGDDPKEEIDEEDPKEEIDEKGNDESPEEDKGEDGAISTPEEGEDETEPVESDEDDNEKVDSGTEGAPEEEIPENEEDIPEGNQKPEGEPEGDSEPEEEKSVDDLAPDEDGDDGKEDKRDLEDECGDDSLDDLLNDEIEKRLSELSKEDKKYLSLKDNDVHEVPDIELYSKEIYKSVLESVAPRISAMTRTLEQALRSMRKCRRNGNLLEGRIDESRMAHITKGTSREVFYKIQRGQDLDVAVEIVIDESGSMYEYKKVMRLAMVIGEALSAVKIPFEITGATTVRDGYTYEDLNTKEFDRFNPILYKHYKNFNEKWMSVRSRLLGIACLHHHVDGEVVEQASLKLLRRKESRKVIFSISDGCPDAGHGNDIVMGANLRRVCKRCRIQGVEVYGFGIGTNEPRKYYGKDYFLYLDCPQSMGVDFIRRFIKILTKGRVRV